MAGEEGKKMYKEYKPWDGTTKESRHRYPVETSAHQLLTDESGNIYYIDGDGRISVWCSVSRLRAHLQRLYQLGVIKEGATV